MQLLRSVRFENNRGMSKQQTPPTPLLTPMCTHCGQVGHGSSRDERSDNCLAYHQTCSKCNNMAILLLYADNSQRPAHAIGNGARACHRKGRTLQLSSSHCVAWKTHTLSTTRSSATFRTSNTNIAYTTLFTTCG